MNRIIAAAAVILVALTAPAWAGIDEGMAALGRGDYTTALRELRPLAKRGHADAQHKLGLMHAEGQGVPQDYAEAAKWYGKAAGQGHAAAQNKFGNLYNLGRGVPQDYVQAAQWYRRAAEQGYEPSQINLGQMYRSGDGVPQDYVQAHMWYNLATSRVPPGNFRDKAVYTRDGLAKRMTPADISKAQELAREWWAKHGKK